jgi:hypothetical protein
MAAPVFVHPGLPQQALAWMLPQFFEANTCVKAVTDDPFISSQAVYVNEQQPHRISLPYPLCDDGQLADLATRNYPIAELEGTAVAIDATYYIQLQLDAQPLEPLLSALAGLTGIQKRLEEDLDQWEKNKVVPFFIFDGQPLVGQDEVTTLRSRQANKKTDFAWDLYFNGQANEAVTAFGLNTSMLLLCPRDGRLLTAGQMPIVPRTYTLSSSLY